MHERIKSILTIGLWASMMFGIFMVSYAQTNLKKLEGIDNYTKTATYSGKGFYGQDTYFGTDKAIGQWIIKHDTGKIIMDIKETGMADIKSKRNVDIEYNDLMWSLARNGSSMVLEQGGGDLMKITLDTYSGGCCHQGKIKINGDIVKASVCKI